MKDMTPEERRLYDSMCFYRRQRDTIKREVQAKTEEKIRDLEHKLFQARLEIENLELYGQKTIPADTRQQEAIWYHDCGCHCDLSTCPDCNS